MTRNWTVLTATLASFALLAVGASSAPGEEERSRLLKIIEHTRLMGLTTLDLSRTGWTSVPPEIGQLKGLTRLELSYNRLTTLPPEIVELKGLTALNRYGNRLTSVPPELGQLKGLFWLNLNDNGLTSLPPELGRLERLATLSVGGNPIIDPPQQIIKQGIGKILEYCRERLELGRQSQRAAYRPASA